MMAAVVLMSTAAVAQDGQRPQFDMKEMIKQIEPTTILVYGGKLDFDYGNIGVVYYENKVTENWKND